MISILHENTDFLVVDKPVGLVVNRSETVNEKTLQDLLEDSYDFYTDKSSEFGMRSGVVHRLDKETSGLLLVAKNTESFDLLKELFMTRSIKKKYIAVAYGHISEPNIEINVPIIRNPLSRTKYAVSREGRSALTEIELLENYEIENTKFCRVYAYPATGRTHQIRVHMTAINHPIVGDTVYAGKNLQKSSISIYNRLMLHAVSLDFSYKDQKYHFESQIPSEFLKVA